MLFKNLKSGNLVEAADATTIELMEASPNYEAVAPTAPAASPEPAAKPAKKKGEAKPAE